MGKGVREVALVERVEVASRARRHGHQWEGWRSLRLPLAHVHDFGQTEMERFSLRSSSNTVAPGAEQIHPECC